MRMMRMMMIFCCCWAPASKDSSDTLWSEYRKKLAASSCFDLVSSDNKDGWILEMLCGWKLTSFRTSSSLLLECTPGTTRSDGDDKDDASDDGLDGDDKDDASDDGSDGDEGPNT